MLYYVYMQSGTGIKIQLALHGTAQGNTQLCHAVSSYAGKPNFYVCNKGLLEKNKKAFKSQVFLSLRLKSHFPTQATTE